MLQLANENVTILGVFEKQGKCDEFEKLCYIYHASAYFLGRNKCAITT